MKAYLVACWISLASISPGLAKQRRSRILVRVMMFSVISKGDSHGRSLRTIKNEVSVGVEFYPIAGCATRKREYGRRQAFYSRLGIFPGFEESGVGSNKTCGPVGFGSDRGYPSSGSGGSSGGKRWRSSQPSAAKLYR